MPGHVVPHVVRGSLLHALAFQCAHAGPVAETAGQSGYSVSYEGAFPDTACRAYGGYGCSYGTRKAGYDLDRIRKIFAHAVQRKAVSKEIAGKFVEYFCGAVEVPQEVFVIKATVSLQKGVSP